VVYLPYDSMDTLRDNHYLSGMWLDSIGLDHTKMTNSIREALALQHGFILPVAQLIRQGHVEVIWQPTTEGLLDEICDRLIEAVRRRGIRRLFIDWLDGFDRLAPESERLKHIFSAFSSEFRGLGISTLFTAESDLIGPLLGLPLSGLALQGVSCIAEIILVTRYVELRSQVRRMISVLKVRDADINSALHEFTMGQDGIVIAPDSASAEDILAEAVGQGREPIPPRPGRISRQQ
jgi:circadian clock protein KaiC